jgi:ABC-type amino acid transport substrate-binding protein
MKLSHIVLVVALSAVTAFGVTKYAAAPTGSATEAKKETAFERVMRTNILRCGYYPYAPVFIKDPSTGNVSGMAVDTMNAIAKKTGLTIEWTEETTFGTWIAGLQAGRFDTVCTPLWGDASYGRVVKFTRPLFYDAAVPLVRANEQRFSTNADDLNKPDVTIAVQDGNMSLALTAALFPKAKTITASANVDYGLVLQDVVSGKADVTFWDLAGYWLYNKTNPGKIKILPLTQPLKIIPCQLPVLQGEDKLHTLIDTGVEDLILSGDMDRIIRKWEPEPGKTFLRVAPPYASEAK